MMCPRPVRPSAVSELEKLSVERLNAYRKKLLALEEPPALPDRASDDLVHLDPDRLSFKEDPAPLPLRRRLARTQGRPPGRRRTPWHELPRETMVRAIPSTRRIGSCPSGIGSDRDGACTCSRS